MAMAPVPSFGSSPLVADTQSAMINANHESGDKSKGGWPKGKPRGPRKARPAAENSTLMLPDTNSAVEAEPDTDPAAGDAA
jgi:hypothetical protein